MNVIQTIINVFRVSELRGKILFTLAMLAVYRIGFWIPVPGVNQQVLSEFFERSAQDGNAAGRLASYVSIFSGGALRAEHDLRAWGDAVHLGGDHLPDPGVGP